MSLYGPILSLSCRAEHFFVLMDDHLDQFVACRAEVFSRIELRGLFGQGFPDHRRHREAAVTVNVDLAYGASRSLPELLSGDANRVLQGAAVLIDDLDVLGDNRRCPVQYDGEARDPLLDLL